MKTQKSEGLRPPQKTPKSEVLRDLEYLGYTIVQDRRFASSGRTLKSDVPRSFESKQ